jgi:hemerythrin-like domain-containing protein
MTSAMSEWTVERDFLEHEHRELVPGLNRIHDVACSVGSIPTIELSRALREVMAWIDHVLRPHTAWEEGWLYPELDVRAGTPWATRLLQFEHRQIRDMTSRVDEDHTRLFAVGRIEVEASSVRCHLFGLEALLRAHVEREERFLLPLLEESRAPSERP